MYVLYNTKIMKKVSSTEMRNNFSHYLSRVAYGGEEFLIEKNGETVAVLVDYDSKGYRGAQTAKSSLGWKLSLLKKLAGGVDLGRLSRKATPDFINKVIEKRYENLLP